MPSVISLTRPIDTVLERNKIQMKQKLCTIDVKSEWPLLCYSRALIYPELFPNDHSSNSSDDFICQWLSFVTIRISGERWVINIETAEIIIPKVNT